MADNLMLQQEVVLLAIHEYDGTFSHGMFIYSVSAGMLSELLLRKKICVDCDNEQMVKLIDDSSTGDEVLDELITVIKESSEDLNLETWVYEAAKLPDLQHRIANQLCEKGILRHDERKVFWIFAQHVYPELDGTVEDAIRDRMAKLMFNEDAEPNGRTAILVSLAHHAGLLNNNFAKEKLLHHKERIDKISTGEILVPGATKLPTECMQSAVLIATMLPSVATSSRNVRQTK